MNTTNKEKRFTGGDQLTGFERKIHEVMMKTELHDGEGAYKLSYAGGKSGFSFGGNQMDLGSGKKKYRELFTDILKKARDINNNLIFTKSNFEKFEEDKDYLVKGKPPQVIFGKELTSQINAALSSEYGINEINNFYVNEIKEKISDVEKVISALTNETNKKAINSDEELKIKLVDYHNQFTMKINGKMMKYLDGEEVTLINKNKDKSQNVHQIQLSGIPTIDEINDFIRRSHQYNKDPESIRSTENRIEKLEKVRGREYIKPSELYEVKGEMVREIGNPGECSLRGHGLCVSRSLSLYANLAKLSKCDVYIKYDDHAVLTVNRKLVHESIDGLNTGFHIERTDNITRIVLQNGTKIQAETWCSKWKSFDAKPYLQNGNNHIKLNVIVEDGGCAYLKIVYK